MRTILPSVYVEDDPKKYLEAYVRTYLEEEIRWEGLTTSAMFGGLKSFLANYPMAKAYFVYLGNRRMFEDKIEIVPVPEILGNLKALLA